jgi:type I restriction enzyme, S subunit
VSWKPKRLDQLGQISRGRSRHRPRDASHLYGGPYPFIQTGDVKHAGLYIRDYEQTYSDAGLAQSRLWPAGTLCITIAANIADTAILDIDACFPDSVIGFIPDDDKADARFVKYLFDATIQRRVQQFTQGAAQDNLSQEKLLSIEFEVPEVDYQRRVADILAAYDLLIDNNLRRITLLEDAAQHVFNEWFVRLRFPGHEHAGITKGVPDGWEIRRLASVAEINKVSLNGSYDGVIDYIDISSVTTGSINEIARYDFREAPSRARRVVKHGDIIWSCVRPNRKSYAVIWQPASTLIASTGFAVITPTALPTTFLLQATTTDAFVGYLENRARGVAYPAVLAGDFERADILVPTETVVEAFNDIAEPLLAQVHTLQLQNDKLRAARNQLLPRLMSGQISA